MLDNELAVVEEKSVLVAFSQEGGLDPVVEEAKKFVDDFKHDMSTAASRKRTASLANKVAKLKTKVDCMGKDLVSDWKSKAKIVDSSRKKMRDDLDELKVLARKPLSEWEAEEEVKKAAEAAKKAQEEIDVQHEMALLMDDKFNREAEEVAAELARVAAAEAEKAERERLEYEKQIIEEAKKEAKKQAEFEAEKAAKIEAARIAAADAEAARVLKEAFEATEKAKRDAIAAEERAKVQAELAEKQRVAAAEKAKQDAIDAAELARKQEVARRESEEAEAKRLADAKAANNAHVGKVRKAIKLAIMKYTDDEVLAKKIVMALHNGELPNATITY